MFTGIVLVIAVAFAVEIHVDPSKNLVINGEASFPKVLGMCAYGGATDFVNTSQSSVGRMFLEYTNVDAIGVYAWLPDVLPPNSYKTLSNVSALESYLKTSEPGILFRNYSRVGEMLRNGLLTEYDTSPWMYLDEYCEAGMPHSICPHGGAPNASDNEWFGVLMAAWMTYADAAYKEGGGKGLEYAHILNEPNAHFWTTGANVSEYLAVFKAAAPKIKAAVPTVQLGGPTTYCGPMGTHNMRPAWGNWEQWVQPVIDADVVDFLDFHAYNESAVPIEIEAAISLVDAYSIARNEKPLKAAITETDYCLISAAERSSYADELQYRAVKHAETISRLWRHPDKVLSRHIFDYGANGVYCFYDVSNRNGTFTATEDVLHLLSTLLPRTAKSIQILDVNSTDASLLATSSLIDGSTVVLLLVNTNNVSLPVQVSSIMSSTFASGVQQSSSGLATLSSPPTTLPPFSTTSLQYTLSTTGATSTKTVTDYPSPNLQVYMRNVTQELNTFIPVPFPTVDSGTTSLSLRVGVKANFQSPPYPHGEPGPTYPVQLYVHACSTVIDAGLVTAYSEISLPCTSSDEISLKFQASEQAQPILAYATLVGTS